MSCTVLQGIHGHGAQPTSQAHWKPELQKHLNWPKPVYPSEPHTCIPKSEGNAKVIQDGYQVDQAGRQENFPIPTQTLEPSHVLNQKISQPTSSRSENQTVNCIWNSIQELNPNAVCVFSFTGEGRRPSRQTQGRAVAITV